MLVKFGGGTGIPIKPQRQFLTKLEICWCWCGRRGSLSTTGAGNTSVAGLCSPPSGWWQPPTVCWWVSEDDIWVTTFSSSGGAPGPAEAEAGGAPHQEQLRASQTSGQVRHRAQDSQALQQPHQGVWYCSHQVWREGHWVWGFSLVNNINITPPDVCSPTSCQSVCLPQTQTWLAPRPGWLAGGKFRRSGGWCLRDWDRWRSRYSPTIAVRVSSDSQAPPSWSLIFSSVPATWPVAETPVMGTLEVRWWSGTQRRTIGSWLASPAGASAVERGEWGTTRACGLWCHEESGAVRIYCYSNRPGVYTRISVFLNWISRNISDN